MKPKIAGSLKNEGLQKWKMENERERTEKEGRSQSWKEEE